MDVITRPRGHGKTYELINLLTSDERYILIVNYHKRKDALVNQYHLLPEVAKRIIVYNNTIREQLAGIDRFRELLVDDADHIIFRLFGQLPRVITVTGRNFDHGRENEGTEDSGDGSICGGKRCRDT